MAGFDTQVRDTLKDIRPLFDIWGAVAFGSRATGSAKEHSDFDLLVVAEGINSVIQRRSDEIAHIKRLFPGVPLDIMLLTPEETVSNFRNHNPLFLDVAVDGHILLDRDGFLTKLITDTKDYITERGIRRIKNGWRFPVQQGVVTYLSRVSNKDFSSAMLNDGEREYIIAGRLRDDGFYDKSVYHAQQSVEKCVKSILAALGIFQKTHFVGEILLEIVEKENVPEAWKEKLADIAEIAEGIEPEVSRSRYPGIIGDSLWLPSEEYKKEDADAAVKKAGIVLSVATGFFSYWFHGKQG